MGRAILEFVTVPTSDTPGAIMSFRFQDGCRYLIGRCAEGTSRACNEDNVGLAKVAAVFITGKTRWENIGGLVGMLLSISDAKSSAHATNLEHNRYFDPSTKVLGPKNLNRAIAAGRRFIFRAGCPLNITEFPFDTADSNSILEPTWKDDNLRVWAMPVLPNSNHDMPPSSSPQTCNTSSRKRTFDEASHIDVPEPSEIVSLMFNSTWKYERLVPQPLSTVPKATTCYVHDPATNELIVYSGPRPGGDDLVEDVTVFARAPWPGSAIVDLPKAKPALENVSYIFRTYPSRGKFDPQKAQGFGVPKGTGWADLSRGRSVKNTLGETITPEMVLGPSRPGTGFAVVDLSDQSYIDGLISRSEWTSGEAVEDITAFIWLVPSDVWNDQRIINFRNSFSKSQHILNSAQYTPDVFSFEKAAANATRHHMLESAVFPALWYKNEAQLNPDVLTARRHLSITIDPKLEYDLNQVPPPLTRASVQEDFKAELAKYPGFAATFESLHDARLGDLVPELEPHGDAEITVLGTGSSHPSPFRNVSGTAVGIPGWGKCILDCGEGTLNNLWRVVVPEHRSAWLVDLKLIWISHLHADHHLGTFSVIKEWDQATKHTPEQKLAVVSDRAMFKWLHEYLSVDNPDLLSRLSLIQAAPVLKGFLRPAEQTTKLTLLRPEMDSEANLERLVDNESATVQDILDNLGIKLLNAVLVDHCKGAMAVSITFMSGFKVSYSGDCIASLSFAKQGRDSHIVIHEATLEDELRVEAISKKHSTPGEALIVAAEMRAKVCLLTHFSQRYPKMPPLGVAVGQKGVYGEVEKVEDVISDDQDNTESTEPGMTDVLPPPDAAAEVEGVAEDPAVSHLLDAPVARGRNKNRLSARVKLIDQSIVQKFVDRTELKVIFAFDYMRFRMDQVPLLERVQPVLREMYNHGIGNDLRLTAEQQSFKEQSQAKMVAREKLKEEKRKRIALASSSKKNSKKNMSQN